MKIHNANLSFGNLTPRRETNRLIYHHTGVTARQTVQVIHNFHRNTQGWAGIGYHAYIRRNGDIWQGRPFEMQGAHASGANFDSIGVAFEGNLETEHLTQEQINSGLWLQAHLFEQFGTLQVLQHRDVGATACAGRNFPIATFQNSGAATAGTPAQPPAPQPQAGMFEVVTSLQGFAIASDAMVGRNPRSTVQPGNYHIFREAFGAVNVTRTAGVAGSWINPQKNVAQSAPSTPQTSQRAFIERVAAVAVKSERIVPSIIIAQAILESGWGTSRLATVANALFGIKADHRWSGSVVNVDTREVCNGRDITIKAPFRAYKSWEDSIKDHQSFLLSSSLGGQLRYEAAFDTRVYEVAAHALQNGGYATDPNYANKLINIIRREGLTEFDILWMPGVPPVDEGDDEMINVQNAAGGVWKNGAGENESRWWYDLGGGLFPRDGLYNIDGKTYHFDGQGWMSTGEVRLGKNRFVFEQTPGAAREGALMRIE